MKRVLISLISLSVCLCSVSAQQIAAEFQQPNQSNYVLERYFCVSCQQFHYRHVKQQAQPQQYELQQSFESQATINEFGNSLLQGAVTSPALEEISPSTSTTAKTHDEYQSEQATTKLAETPAESAPLQNEQEQQRTLAEWADHFSSWISWIPEYADDRTKIATAIPAEYVNPRDIAEPLQQLTEQNSVRLENVPAHQQPGYKPEMANAFAQTTEPSEAREAIEQLESRVAENAIAFDDKLRDDIEKNYSNDIYDQFGLFDRDETLPLQAEGFSWMDQAVEQELQTPPATNGFADLPRMDSAPDVEQDDQPASPSAAGNLNQADIATAESSPQKTSRYERLQAESGAAENAIAPWQVAPQDALEKNSLPAPASKNPTMQMAKSEAALEQTRKSTSQTPAAVTTSSVHRVVASADSTGNKWWKWIPFLLTPVLGWQLLRVVGRRKKEESVTDDGDGIASSRSSTLLKNQAMDSPSPINRLQQPAVGAAKKLSLASGNVVTAGRQENERPEQQRPQVSVQTPAQIQTPAPAAGLAVNAPEVVQPALGSEIEYSAPTSVEVQGKGKQITEALTAAGITDLSTFGPDSRERVRELMQSQNLKIDDGTFDRWWQELQQETAPRQLNVKATSTELKAEGQAPALASDLDAIPRRTHQDQPASQITVNAPEAAQPALGSKVEYSSPSSVGFQHKQISEALSAAGITDLSTCGPDSRERVLGLLQSQNLKIDDGTFDRWWQELQQETAPRQLNVKATNREFKPASQVAVNAPEFAQTAPGSEMECSTPSSVEFQHKQISEALSAAGITDLSTCGPDSRERVRGLLQSQNLKIDDGTFDRWWQELQQKTTRRQTNANAKTSELQSRSVKKTHRVKSKLSTDKDDLTQIQGIGQATQRALYSENIHSLEQIAAMSVSELETVFANANMDFAAVEPGTWSQQATELLGQRGVADEIVTLNEAKSLARTVREPKSKLAVEAQGTRS